MNNWIELHKHSQRTSLCICLIPLFETVTPEDMHGATDGRGGVLRDTVLQQTQKDYLLCAF